MARQAICGGANPSNVVGGESILRSCPGPLNQQLIQRCMCAGYRSPVMSTRLAAAVISRGLPGRARRRRRRCFPVGGGVWWCRGWARSSGAGPGSRPTRPARASRCCGPRSLPPNASAWDTARFVGPHAIAVRVVRTVGGPDATPRSADRTPHGLDESRSAGRGRSELTWFGRQPAATKRFGALTFQNASFRGGYAYDG